jgi:asparagine synthase (glutamine-hydrolysing)
MCGIVGRASRHATTGVSGLTGGIAALRHRGPDANGEWCSDDSLVRLGHTRLAIIDLSSAARQPMVDCQGSSVIVFNGEIYNYRRLREQLKGKGHTFRTASDTEVILAAYREWGTDCICHFDGMFAFALFDSGRRRLFLARDRAGEKPLYYSFDAWGIRFASELKALMSDPEFDRLIDREGLDCYLALGYVPGSRSILKGVNKLPPAHALTFELDGSETRIWRYWHLPASHSRVLPVPSELELLKELEFLLDEAVQSQMVADVPVGVLLSGGVDSSLVTAMAARSSSRVKTFTVRFPGHAAYDETEHARLVATYFATEHVELEAGEASVELVSSLARQFDEPIADSSMVPTYLVSKLVRQHCTVALGGDGGDELFGGYDHYRRLLRFQQWARFTPAAMRRIVAAGAGRALPIGTRGRNWLQGSAIDLNADIPGFDLLFDAKSRRELLAPYAWVPVAERIRAARIPRESNLLERATRMDFENYLAEDILVKVDRASMLTSLEVRAPFLDRSVVEFAFSKVAPSLKASPTKLKILPKKLSERVLPKGFDRNRKQGFSIPLGSWLRSGAWADFFRSVLLDAGCLFERKTVTDLLAGQRKGRNNTERLFALALFELWRREYRVTF